MLNFHDDPKAFNAFIKEHQDRVYNLILNRVQNVEDAEEIAQDVFIAVFRKPEAFRGESSVSTWLYRIAINKCIDYLRRKKRSNGPRVLSFFVADDKSNEPEDFVHPGIVSENKEKANILFKAMKKLPPNQHTAWVLSEMDSRTYKEISEIMKLSLSSVESLLFRARQNLKRILGEMYTGE